MFGAFWFSVAAFMVLFVLLLTLRVRLEHQRDELDRLEGLLEADHDARRDVAVAVRGDARLQVRIGREAGMDAQVRRVPARARPKSWSSPPR